MRWRTSAIEIDRYHVRRFDLDGHLQQRLFRWSPVTPRAAANTSNWSSLMTSARAWTMQCASATILVAFARPAYGWQGNASFNAWTSKRPTPISILEYAVPCGDLALMGDDGAGLARRGAALSISNVNLVAGARHQFGPSGWAERSRMPIICCHSTTVTGFASAPRILRTQDSCPATRGPAAVRSLRSFPPDRHLTRRTPSEALVKRPPLPRSE